MLKPVSFLVIALFGVISVFPGNAAQMTPQIQELLRQKEEKAKQLEACDGKRKAWMIAGISTIGLTAVGVGVNIAQASNSKKLDTSINSANNILKNQEAELNRINTEITEKERGGPGKKGGGSGGGQPDLDSSVDGTGYVYKDIASGHIEGNNGTCSVSKPGDWCVDFPWGTVSGIASCSSLPGTDYEVASDQSVVDGDYIDTVTSTPAGGNCYCKMTSPSASRWVLVHSYSVSGCASTCAFDCAFYVRNSAGFREVIFRAVAP